MNCPVCITSELSRNKLDSELSSQQCPSCLGNWIDGTEYWNWVEEHGTDLAERVHETETLSLAARRAWAVFHDRSLPRMQRHLARRQRMGSVEEAQSARRLEFDVHVLLAERGDSRSAQKEDGTDLQQQVRRRRLCGNQAHPLLAGHEDEPRRIARVPNR